MITCKKYIRFCCFLLLFISVSYANNIECIDVDIKKNTPYGFKEFSDRMIVLGITPNNEVVYLVEKTLTSYYCSCDALEIKLQHIGKNDLGKTLLEYDSIDESIKSLKKWALNQQVIKEMSLDNSGAIVHLLNGSKSSIKIELTKYKDDNSIKNAKFKLLKLNNQELMNISLDYTKSKVYNIKVSAIIEIKKSGHMGLIIFEQDEFYDGDSSFSPRLIWQPIVDKNEIK